MTWMKRCQARFIHGDPVISQLLLGARLAVTGGRDSWLRTGLTAFGVALGVGLLLAAASLPHAVNAHRDRTAARTDFLLGPSPQRSDRTAVVTDVPSEFRNSTVRGVLLQPDGAHPPVPPGIPRVPAPGETYVSQAVRDVLASPDGDLLRPRIPGRIIGTIDDGGVAGPAELWSTRSICHECHRTPREDLPARPSRAARCSEAIARRLPAFVRARSPDRAGARGGGRRSRCRPRPGWLWAAAALLVVHWLGDSLDGTLARVRRAERPRYGYYLDHLADAVATALVGLGLGLSAHMHLAAGLVLVIAYLALSINSYLETQALGRLLARLRPARADRGAAGADRAARRRSRSARRGAVLGGADAARRRRAGRRRRSWCVARRGARALGNLRVLARAGALHARRSARRAGPPPRTPRACGRTGRRARCPSRSTARAP